MRYYKVVDNGYINAVGRGIGGTEISESEYLEIMSVVRNKPQVTETTDYQLRENLTWEAYEHEPIPEVDPDAEEALAILLGGAV